MKYKITLVLGAGASVAMGYPVGSELTKEIITNAEGSYSQLICDEVSHHQEELEDFIDQFKKSQINSIDEFLAKRKEFREIGKRTIAAILLDKEDPEKLWNCSHKDHWYKYFFNQLVNGKQWDELDFSRISIVTFNYDRSLEHYLASALTALYGKPTSQSFNKISEMNIIHVYGSIGPCDPKEKNYFTYGDGKYSNHLKIAESQLKVIPEGRDDDPTLTQARNALASSERIAFLGFGFDKTNLERLNSRETCRQHLENEDGYLERMIIASTLGMSNPEILVAARTTANPNLSIYDVIGSRNVSAKPTTP